MTIQTAVLIETLVDLGATVRWSLLQHFLDAGPRRRRPSPPPASPVFAWKGMNEEEFWWCIEQTLRGPDGWTPNMILDDGGDLTNMVHDKYPELLPASAASRRRPPPACIASTRWPKPASCCARDQRQRQRHQVEVRQSLWLPRIAWSTASAAAPT
jgi:S-adenosylhomocysteine hydrolase